MAGKTKKMFLFDHPVSSYAQKVRIALRAKGLPFDHKVPENMGTGLINKDLLAANPRMEVPVLVDGDIAIFDSTVILQYLEEAYPENPLLPSGPKERAQVRMIEEICDSQYEAINWGFAEVVFHQRARGETERTLLDAVRRNSAQIQAWLELQLDGKPYFNGETFGYADVCVAPMLNRNVLAGFGPEEGSALQKYHARIQEHESIQETFAEVNKGMQTFSKVGDFFQKEGRSREYRDHRLEWMIKSGGIEVVLEGLKKNTIRFCRLPNE